MGGAISAGVFRLLHRIKPQSDTGIQIELLQEYVFIGLDIFQKSLDNKYNNITDELEAWLAFLSIDQPDIILKLIEAYPQFEALYREVYEMCLNLERMMTMFSKELAELDKSTVQYMIDEMQDRIDELSTTVNEQNRSIDEKNLTIDKQNLTIDKQSLTINDLKNQLEALQKELETVKNLRSDKK